MRAAAAQGWEKAELVAKKSPVHKPVNLRRTVTGRGVQMWAQKAAAKKLRRVVAKTLPQRIRLTLETFHQAQEDRDFSDRRRKWLELAEEEQRAEQTYQKDSLAAVKVRHLSNATQPPESPSERFRLTIMEDQKGLKDWWKAIG